MPFQKGQSGNPAGRKPGSTCRRLSLLRQAFEEHSEELMAKVIELALAGDTAMLKLCIDRILPAYKPVEIPVELPELARKRKCITKAKVVLDSVAAGELSISEGRKLLSGISSLIDMTELQELSERIAALEKELEVHDD